MIFSILMMTDDMMWVRGVELKLYNGGLTLFFWVVVKWNAEWCCWQSVFVWRMSEMFVCGGSTWGILASQTLDVKSFC